MPPENRIIFIHLLYTYIPNNGMRRKYLEQLEQLYLHDSCKGEIVKIVPDVLCFCYNGHNFAKRPNLDVMNLMAMLLKDAKYIWC